MPTYDGLTSQDVLDATQAGVVVLDDQGGVLSANPAACQALGWATGAPPADLGAGVRIGQPGWLAPEGWSPDVWTTAGGARCPVSYMARALPPLSGQGWVVTFVPTMHMLTSAEADQASQDTNAFISALSHELRTPLNALLGFAQLLEMDDLNEEQAESVEQILTSGRHLLSLITATLDITRIESGHVPLELEPTSVGLLCEQVVALMSIEAAQRGSRIEVVSPSQTGSALVDRGRLRQVLLNLIGNALKYGGPAGVVHVEVLTQGPWCQIRVSDIGPGISPADAERIFQPFQRLAGTSSEVGTGLGLPLTRSLVESMGGTLELEGRPGAGSCFRVRLPAAGHADGADPRRSKLDEAVRGRVLYVEDNEGNVRLVERLMARRPEVTLDLVATLDEARAKLSTTTYEAVLLDLVLPDGRGEELLAGELDDHPTTTVVVMSGDQPGPALRARLAALGHSFLAKPLEIGRFLQVLDEAVNRPAARALR